jgi:hypothetical protein
MAETDSILDSTKKMLAIESDDTGFDLDIITHINGVFTTLQQLGIGPSEGFMITDKDAVWASFLGVDKFNAVKSYMYLKVRLLFDPPSSSSVLAAFERQITELEWRLNVLAEGKNQS